MTEQTTASPASTALAAPVVLLPAAVPAQTETPARPVLVPDTFTFTRAPSGRAAVDAGRGTSVRLAPLWTATALCITVLTAFFVLIVSGRVVTEGPVVAVLTRTHGIHLGDLFALALWCAATGALLLAALTTTSAVRGRAASARG